MDDMQARGLICQTGRELLQSGLVARTWGNVSCRVDERSFLISPSGLDYTKTHEEDIVLFNSSTGEVKGLHKPSSEKGIHAAAYEIFPDVGFVVHTHQSCASALGLAGFDGMDISESERARLGGIAKAEYGLPGTKKLKNAVRAAMASGAKTVLMEKHGAVVCGTDKADAMEMIALLEDICRRNLRLDAAIPERLDAERVYIILDAVRAAYPNAAAADSDAALMWASRERKMPAQLDDMAQMLGSAVQYVPANVNQVLAQLAKRDAVFVPGIGAIVKADTADDAQALTILASKSALAAVHAENLGARIRLSRFDAALMRFVYLNKYSKQKG